MSRSCFTFSCRSFQEAKNQIENVLRSNGYSLKNENGEIVWKKGSGWLTAMKYVKYEFTGDKTVQIYGWVRPMASQEQNLDGVVCALPKRQVLNLIQAIGNALQ